MKYLRLLLLPLSLLYGGIMLLRNYLYRTGWFKTHEFDMPVITVGNLTVGGTGKTPHVEYLLRLLSPYRRAVLSRGYKRRSKGFVLADGMANAATLGDEPYQYHLDFPEVTVAVSEKRVQGIVALRQLTPPPELVVLDDAMQHRAVRPSLLLMLTDYGRLFYRDFVLPAGLLREPRHGAERADAIIVSKCPSDMAAAERAAIEKAIRSYAKPATPVFFSSFRYGQPVAFGSASSITKNIVLLTGIANADPLVAYLQQEGYTLMTHKAYADHYHYTARDLAELKSLVEGSASQGISVVTTRKDAVKLTEPVLQGISSQLPIFYIPIEVVFLENAVKFDALVMQHVAEFASEKSENSPF